MLLRPTRPTVRDDVGGLDVAYVLAEDRTRLDLQDAPRRHTGRAARRMASDPGIVGSVGSERPHQRMDLRLLGEADPAQLLDVALAPEGSTPSSVNSIVPLTPSVARRAGRQQQATSKETPKHLPGRLSSPLAPW